MSKVTLAVLVAVFGLALPGAYALDVPGAPKDTAGADSKNDVAATFDPLVENALKAYNKEDFKAFFADYSKSLSAMATEPVFKMMFIDTYKKDLGNYVSRKLVADQSSKVVGDANVLVYNAQFEKNKNVRISVNVNKEDGKFKFVQIRFDKQ